MSNLRILVWKNPEGTGEPEVEVTIPTRLARWIPRMMKFMPRKTMEENWGGQVDWESMLSEVDSLIKEAEVGGAPELVRVKTRDSFVRITVEK